MSAAVSKVRVNVGRPSADDVLRGERSLPMVFLAAAGSDLADRRPHPPAPLLRHPFDGFARRSSASLGRRIGGRRTTQAIRLGDTRIAAGRSVRVPSHTRTEAFGPVRFAPARQATRDRHADLPFAPTMPPVRFRVTRRPHGGMPMHVVRRER